MPLTDKQQRFIDLYVIPSSDGSLNATKAYRAAYPACRSDRAAEAAASRLLSNVIIRTEVDRRLAAISKKCRLTAETAWMESRYIATSDIGEVMDFTGETVRMRPASEIPESARRAISSMKVKRYTEGHGEDARVVEVTEFKFWDKPGQLNTTLRALGELKDTIEHSGPGGGPMQMKLSGNLTHEPTLEAADIALAETLADSFTDQGPDSPAEPGIHPDSGPEPVDHERNPDHSGDAER